MTMLNRQPVHTDQAPAAVGPYSQGIISNGFVFVSGQTPIDPSTGKLIDGDIAAQTEQVFKNLTAILEAAGTSLATAAPWCGRRGSSGRPASRTPVRPQ